MTLECPGFWSGRCQLSRRLRMVISICLRRLPFVWPAVRAMLDGTQSVSAADKSIGSIEELTANQIQTPKLLSGRP